MKPFEIPTIEIERFALVDTIAVSLVSENEEEVPTFTLPDDEW